MVKTTNHSALRIDCGPLLCFIIAASLFIRIRPVGRISNNRRAKMPKPGADFDSYQPHALSLTADRAAENRGACHPPFVPIGSVAAPICSPPAQPLFSPFSLVNPKFLH
jgi:hypothetical protein